MPDAAIDLSLPPGLPPSAGRTAVTVGTFDGVHRGHWAVLQELCAEAEAAGLRSVLVTFDPHPLRIVRPEAAPPLLTTAVEKTEILAESGVDYAVFLPFTRALANYEPRRFVEEILIGRLRMDRLIIGYDHGFGRGRSGDVDELQRLGAELGFDLRVVQPVQKGEHAISSTRIRHALEEGDVAAAAAGLGRPYSVRGPVVRGEGRGRRLGFPTANVHVESSEKLLPLEGIYAVRGVLRTRAVDGVLHLGPRPTFQGSPPTIELHLFDFHEDLYGTEIRIDFCARLRGIHRFASVEALVEAIRDDCAAARRVLRAGAGACS